MCIRDSICDGHHRIQAMLKSKKKIAPMIIAFPDNQVNILDYNRVVKTSLKFEKIKKIIEYLLAVLLVLTGLFILIK